MFIFCCCLDKLYKVNTKYTDCFNDIDFKHPPQTTAFRISRAHWFRHFCTQRHIEFTRVKGSDSLSGGCCCQLPGEVRKSRRHQIKPKCIAHPAFHELIVQLVGGQVLYYTCSLLPPILEPVPSPGSTCGRRWAGGRGGSLLDFAEGQHLWYKEIPRGPGRVREGRQPVQTGAEIPGGSRVPLFSLLPTSGKWMGPQFVKQMLEPVLRPPPFQRASPRIRAYLEDKLLPLSLPADGKHLQEADSFACTAFPPTVTGLMRYPCTCPAPLFTTGRFRALQT